MAWAEADRVVADEFREGNAPARQAPLACVKAAFAALPETLSGRMSYTGNTLKLRLPAGLEPIRRLQRVWQVFALPPQATYSG